MDWQSWVTAKAEAFVGAGVTMTATSVVCVAVIFGWEIVRLGMERSSVGAIRSGNPSARRDLLSYVLDITGLLRILGHIATLGVGYGIGAWIHSALDLDLSGVIANAVVQTVALLFLNSFVGYWMHRWMHSSPVLWEIHKYHHSAEEMNVVSAHRESILVAPFSSLFLAIPLGVLGSPATTFVAVAVLTEFHALLIHSRLSFGFGWLDRLLISPRAHRLHHSLERSRGTRNFGFLFSIWDHVYGTYEHSADGEFPVGVECDVYNRVPWHREMLHTMQATGRAAVAPLARRRVAARV